jgi:hypothetical protein
MTGHHCAARASVAEARAALVFQRYSPDGERRPRGVSSEDTHGAVARHRAARALLSLVGQCRFRCQELAPIGVEVGASAPHRLAQDPDNRKQTTGLDHHALDS